jgi:two-component system, NarL family, sensor histidine kinase DegS
MALTTQLNENDPWEDFRRDTSMELEHSERALKEITMMLDQSQIDLKKLTQRNTAITAHLQQVQVQIDSIPRGDIKMAYDSALDVQQRILLTRGQLEKLQSDQSYLQKYIELIKRLRRMSEGEKPIINPQPINTKNSLELIINAQESERQRLSRQMHDGPAQALSNFILQTEIAMRLFDINQAQAKDELTNLKMAAMNTFQKVRNFIFELRPMMLDDLGLVPTFRRYTETFKEQTSIDTTLVVSGVERRLEPYLEIMIFRALQELMGNVVKHGQANRIKIQFTLDDNMVRLSVDDNGKGFNPDTITEGSGMGLSLIKERVGMLGGTMEIDSVIGQGTKVLVEVPTTAYQQSN